MYPLLFSLGENSRDYLFMITSKRALAASCGPFISYPRMPSLVRSCPTTTFFLNRLSKYARAIFSCISLNWMGPNGLAKYVETSPFSDVVPFAILAPCLETEKASSTSEKLSHQG